MSSNYNVYKRGNSLHGSKYISDGSKKDHDCVTKKIVYYNEDKKHEKKDYYEKKEDEKKHYAASDSESDKKYQEKKHYEDKKHEDKKPEDKKYEKKYEEKKQVDKKYEEKKQNTELSSHESESESENKKKKLWVDKKHCEEKIQWVEVKRKCCEKVPGVCLVKNLLNSFVLVETVVNPFPTEPTTRRFYHFIYEINIINNTCHKLTNLSLFDNLGGFLHQVGCNGVHLNFQVIKSRGDLVVNDTLEDDIEDHEIEVSLLDTCKSCVKPCSVASLVFELVITVDNTLLKGTFNNTAILEACIERKESKPECPGGCGCCSNDDCCFLKKDKIQPLTASHCLDLLQVDRLLLNEPPTPL